MSDDTLAQINETSITNTGKPADQILVIVNGERVAMALVPKAMLSYNVEIAKFLARTIPQAVRAQQATWEVYRDGRVAADGGLGPDDYASTYQVLPYA